MRNRIGRGQDAWKKLVALMIENRVRLEAVVEMFSNGMGTEEVLAKIAA